MSQKENNDKLGTGLVPKKIAKTCTRFKLRFTDHAIENYQSDFQKLDKDGQIIGKKYRTYTPFETSKHTFLKGLKLCKYEKSKANYFVLNYWYEK